MKIVDIPNLDLVVELVGGSSGLALELAKKTLNKKKFLVTANKALIAMHGSELFKIADNSGVKIGYEAAVGAAIPIINTLENRLLSDKITGIYGILNGTCNFILSEMSQKKLSFETALKNAQELGFAEANPYDDISGTDSAYKLLILTNLVFATNFVLQFTRRALQMFLM